MNSEERVSSTRNPLVRRFRAAAQGEPPDVVIADGFHLSTEALTAGLRLVAFAWSPKLRQRDGGETLLRRLRQTAAQEHACTDRVLAQLSSLKTHQGVVALLQRPNPALADLVKGDAPLLVVAAEVQDPGNLGALVRGAEAAGASGLVALAGSAHPFRDKAVRGSMGSVFRLPCVAEVSTDAVVELLRGSELSVVAAEQEGGRPYWEADLTGPVALVLGSESSGVPAALLEIATVRVSIPIARPVESLNVAVAAGVLLFEARRQRT